ncbi:MAG: sulfotransferase [gamma proteobacterium symbiont of Bathyaustriella thionipta]|nr:sulfotransferase [gamma proteobacterium symbiont of Bathyaustriella thionipta]
MKIMQGASAALVDEMLPDLPSSFYIIGAPRCGTTALSKVLGENPQVSFAKPKEAHFLGDDYTDRSVQEIQHLYLEHFHPNLSLTTRAIGDGSVSYLYSPDAIRQALRLDPDARFIVLVRNPLDMLRSYHQRLLFLLDEEVADFASAWNLQQERAAGQKLPDTCREPRALQYGNIGSLGRHVEQLFEVAGADRCEVVVFDDFVKDPRAVYLRLLEFIGIDDDGRSKFNATRSNAGYKSRWLQQYSMNPPPWVYHLIRISNAKSLSRLKGIRKRIKKFNRAKAKAQPMDPAMQTVLRDYYREDVARLSTLLKRDLSGWLQE